MRTTDIFPVLRTWNNTRYPMLSQDTDQYKLTSTALLCAKYNFCPFWKYQKYNLDSYMQSTHSTTACKETKACRTWPIIYRDISLLSIASHNDPKVLYDIISDDGWVLLQILQFSSFGLQKYCKGPSMSFAVMNVLSWKRKSKIREYWMSVFEGAFYFFGAKLKS